MNKKQIHDHIGAVIGYRNPRTGFTAPVRVMDSRMWEIHKGPSGWRVLPSDHTLPYHHAGVEIGYPVLTTTGTSGNLKNKKQELERWIGDTEYTMTDLYDEDGKEKGVFPEGIILKVVSGRHLTQDYAKVAEQEKKREQQTMEEWKKKLEVSHHATDTAAAINKKMLAMGFTSEDGKDIVRTQGIGSKRVNIDVDFLYSLLCLAEQVSQSCAWCDTHGVTVPFEQEGLSDVMLCLSCHPVYTTYDTAE